MYIKSNSSIREIILLFVFFALTLSFIIWFTLTTLQFFGNPALIKSSLKMQAYLSGLIQGSCEQVFGDVKSFFSEIINTINNTALGGSSIDIKPLNLEKPQRFGFSPKKCYLNPFSSTLEMAKDFCLWMPVPVHFTFYIPKSDLGFSNSFSNFFMWIYYKYFQEVGFCTGVLNAYCLCPQWVEHSLCTHMLSLQKQLLELNSLMAIINATGFAFVLSAIFIPCVKLFLFLSGSIYKIWEYVYGRGYVILYPGEKPQLLIDTRTRELASLGKEYALRITNYLVAYKTIFSSALVLLASASLYAFVIHVYRYHLHLIKVSDNVKSIGVQILQIYGVYHPESSYHLKQIYERVEQIATYKNGFWYFFENAPYGDYINSSIFIALGFGTFVYAVYRYIWFIIPELEGICRRILPQNNNNRPPERGDANNPNPVLRAPERDNINPQIVEQNNEPNQAPNRLENPMVAGVGNPRLNFGERVFNRMLPRPEPQGPQVAPVNVVPGVDGGGNPLPPQGGMGNRFEINPEPPVLEDVFGDEDVLRPTLNQVADGVQGGIQGGMRWLGNIFNLQNRFETAAREQARQAQDRLMRRGREILPEEGQNLIRRGQNVANRVNPGRGQAACPREWNLSQPLESILETIWDSLWFF